MRSSSLPRRKLLRAGLASGLALVLPQARACEFFSTHLRIVHPWARASAADADFAVLNMSFDQVSSADRLIRVETPVADGAELGGAGSDDGIDLPIPQGQTTVLSESGVHVRLVGLRQALEVGRSYPLTLVFAYGGTVNASLNVDFPSQRFS